MNEQVRIPKRVASVVINSLKGGVVPRIGLSYITVGRKTEIDALLGDVGVIRGLVSLGELVVLLGPSLDVGRLDEVPFAV